MAQDGSVESRAHAGARAGTWSGPWPWPVGNVGRPCGVTWPRANFAPKTQLRQWVAQEVAADRLLPWLAVAYGLGIVIYFTAEREPAWWAATTLAAACAVGAMLLRRNLAALIIGLFVFAIAAGFAAATVKTALIEHPVLHYSASGVTIAGFVELREESQHTDRFVLRVDRIDGNRIDDKPQRVRLSVKRGLAPPAGSFVEVKAMLDPPLQPLAPGSYDFARDLYFQRVG
jgi:competence protein ComEC